MRHELDVGVAITDHPTLKMKPLLLDGGLGTALEESGSPLYEDCLWAARYILDDPDTIADLHSNFFEAGWYACPHLIKLL